MYTNQSSSNGRAPRHGQADGLSMTNPAAGSNPGFSPIWLFLLFQVVIKLNFHLFQPFSF